MASVAIDVEDMENELCEVCFLDKPSSDFHEFKKCHHRFCTECVVRSYKDKITSSMIDIQCLRCKAEVHPEELRFLISDELYNMYLDRSLRKYLSTLPEARFCFSPDCPFACIAAKVKRRSEEDNHFVCLREECKKEFCNECKLPWHPGKDCEQARAEAGETEFIPESTLKAINAKACPSCKSLIEKLEDGTCNEVKCTMCGTTFCWLCLQPVSEMHFMSPTGCPMYGRRRWSRKKRYCCRLWLWLLAPFGTLLVSFLLIPVIVVILPLLVPYLVATSNCTKRKHVCSRVILTVVSLVITLLVTFPIAFLAALLIIPILLFYAYCFVPVHICMQTAS